MNLLDVAVVLIALTYALSGYLRGFVSAFATAAGVVLGVTVGLLAIPVLVRPTTPSLGTSLLAIGLVLVLAVLGAATGGAVGKSLRDEMSSGPARAVDAVAGAALTGVVTLVVSWALGYAAGGAQIPVLSQQARDSAVLRAIDGVLPDGSRDALRAFTDVVDTSLFPRYLDPFEDEVIVSVEPADAAILDDPDVRAARDRVARITGEAQACNRRIEGSGFVYAPGRVMTNAHVVAGVTEPEVRLGGRTYRARVVVFNPELDVAVLAVEGLRVQPLQMDETAEPGDSGVVMGFPQNGPFDARPARLRSEERLRSTNIYNRGVVHRQAFSLRTVVRPGNSGGPLISADGTVIGVVFAASVRDSDTGYALTAEAVREDARLGTRASSAVPTGGCA